MIRTARELTIPLFSASRVREACSAALGIWLAACGSGEPTTATQGGGSSAASGGNSADGGNGAGGDRASAGGAGGHRLTGGGGANAGEGGIAAAQGGGGAANIGGSVNVGGSIEASGGSVSGVGGAGGEATSGGASASGGSPSTNGGAGGTTAGEGGSDCMAVSGAPCDGSDADLCEEGTITCTPSGQSCSDITGDAVELCDWQDNDCDGLVDNAATGWIAETVFGTGGVGQYTSLAIDSAGGHHVAFYELKTFDLKYAYRAPGASTWAAPELVDAIGNVGIAVSIAVDSDANVHLAYRDATNQRLKYATRAALTGQWTASVIDATNNTGEEPSIAVDANDAVHVAYRRNTNKRLMYAYLAPGGSWVLEHATPSADARAPSLDVDWRGGVHVSYYDATTQALRYVYRAPGEGWTNSVLVDGAARSGQASDVAVDASDGVHIAYYRGFPDKDLRYAKKDFGGDWQSGEAPLALSSTNYGLVPNIAVDFQGTVHIAFRDEAGKRLMSAVKADGAWTEGVIDASTNAGSSLSLKMASGGQLGVAYYDATNQDVKFASRCTGGFTECPTKLSFELDAGNADIDIGVSGLTHNVPWVSGAMLTINVVGCEGAAPPCGECQLAGVASNAGPVVNGRCSDMTERCASDADCASGPCTLYYGAPTPLEVGGSAVCLLTTIDPAASGAVHIETGVGGIAELYLSSWVAMGISHESPCVRCVGDAAPRDGVRSGTCENGGVNDGGACDAESWSEVFQSWTSLDCPMNSGANIGKLDLPVGPLGTAGADWELTDASPDCTENAGTKCFCPSDSGGNGTESNGCTDFDGCMESPAGSGEGICDSETYSDFLTYCEGNAYNDFIPCSSNESCSFNGGGTCTRWTYKTCFPDNGAIGAHLVASGQASSLSGGAAVMRAGSNFCIDAASNSAINSAGLPGPGRIQASVHVRQWFD